MDSLRTIESLRRLPEPALPQAAAKAPESSFSSAQVKILKNPNLIPKGDLSRFRSPEKPNEETPLETTVKQYADHNNKTVQDTPHDGNSWVTAANYVFLSYFKSKPKFRDTTIKKLEKQAPKPKAYLALLKNLNEFLQTNTLSDEELMMFMTHHAKVINAFTRTVIHTDPESYQGPDKKIKEFAKAVEIQIPHHTIDISGNLVAEEKQDNSLETASKTLVFVATEKTDAAKGENKDHYVILEPKSMAAAPADLIPLQNLIQKAQTQQKSNIDSLSSQINTVKDYEKVQDLHINLIEASRIAVGAQEEGRLKALLKILRSKENELNLQAMVHLDDLITGMKQYSKLLDNPNYKPDLKELQRKKELMEFNIRQLQTDQKAEESTKIAFADLYAKILARIRTQEGRPVVNWKKGPRTRAPTPIERANVAVQSTQVTPKDAGTQAEDTSFADENAILKKNLQAQKLKTAEALANATNRNFLRRTFLTWSKHAQIESLKRQYQEALKRLNQDYETKVQALNRDYETSKTKFENEIKTLNQRNADVQNALRMRVEKLEQYQKLVNSNFETYAAGIQAQIDLVTNQYAEEAKKERDAIIFQMNAKLSIAQTENTQKIATLQAEIRQLKMLEGKMPAAFLLSEPGKLEPDNRQRKTVDSETPSISLTSRVKVNSGSRVVARDDTLTQDTKPRVVETVPLLNTEKAAKPQKRTIAPPKILNEQREPVSSLEAAKEVAKNVALRKNYFSRLTEKRSRILKATKLKQELQQQETIARQAILNEEIESFKQLSLMASEGLYRAKTSEEAEAALNGFAKPLLVQLQELSERVEATGLEAQAIEELKTAWNESMGKALQATQQKALTEKATKYIEALKKDCNEAFEKLSNTTLEAFSANLIQEYEESIKELFGEAEESLNLPVIDDEITPLDEKKDKQWMSYIVAGTKLPADQVTAAKERFEELFKDPSVYSSTKTEVPFNENNALFAAALAKLILNTNPQETDVRNQAQKLLEYYLSRPLKELRGEKRQTSRRILVVPGKEIRSLTFPRVMYGLFQAMEPTAKDGVLKKGLELNGLMKKRNIKETPKASLVSSGQAAKISFNPKLLKVPSGSLLEKTHAVETKKQLEKSWTESQPPKTVPQNLKDLVDMALNDGLDPAFLARFPDGGISVLRYIYLAVICELRLQKSDDPNAIKFFKNPASVDDLLHTLPETATPAEKSGLLMRAMRVMTQPREKGGLGGSPLSRTQTDQLRLMRHTGLNSVPFHAEAGQGKSEMIRIFPRLYLANKPYVLHVSPFPEENKTGFSLDNLPTEVSENTPVIPVTAQKFKDWLERNPTVALKGLVVLDEYDSPKYMNIRENLFNRNVSPFEMSATRNRDDLTVQRERYLTQLRVMERQSEQGKDTAIRVIQIQFRLKQLEKAQEAQFNRNITFEQGNLKAAFKKVTSVNLAEGKNSVLVEIPDTDKANETAEAFKTHLDAQEQSYVLRYRDDAGVMHEISGGTGGNIRTYCLYTKDARGGDFGEYSNQRVGAQVLLYRDTPSSDEFYQHLRRNRAVVDLSAPVFVFTQNKIEKTKFLEEAKKLQETMNLKALKLRFEQKIREAVKREFQKLLKSELPDDFKINVDEDFNAQFERAKEVVWNMNLEDLNPTLSSIMTETKEEFLKQIKQIPALKGDSNLFTDLVTMKPTRVGTPRTSRGVTKTPSSTRVKINSKEIFKLFDSVKEKKEYDTLKLILEPIQLKKYTTSESKKLKDSAENLYDLLKKKAEDIKKRNDEVIKNQTIHYQESEEVTYYRKLLERIPRPAEPAAKKSSVTFTEPSRTPSSSPSTMNKLDLSKVRQNK